jgi:putative Mn2+ efflux pump MntP
VTALLLLAVALGLGNLAAAVGIGVGGVDRGTRVRIAVVFGLFEAGMPILGLLLGNELADTAGRAARWLGGAALVAFGVVGLVRAWREARAGTGDPRPGGADTEAPEGGRDSPGGSSDGAGAWSGGPGSWSGRSIGRMLVAGLVLSADNLAAGFALGAYHTSLALAAIVFGVVSVAMSLAGLELGARIGAAAGERSELVACVLLIVVGAVIATGVL